VGLLLRSQAVEAGDVHVRESVEMMLL
jgi:hypothetical protein